VKTVKALKPPATKAELDGASAIWTAAQDIMVKRGYGLALWGNQRACCHEFVVLMLRAVATRETFRESRRSPVATRKHPAPES